MSAGSHSQLTDPASTGMLGGTRGLCVSELAACSSNTPATGSLSSVIPPVLSSRALGDSWDRCPVMVNSVGFFCSSGEEVTAANILPSGQQPENVPNLWTLFHLCLLRGKFLSVQMRASLSPSLRHPVLTVMSVTHMVPGRELLHSQALSGEHLLTLPA